jgi:hypothetical protein
MPIRSHVRRRARALTLAAALALLATPPLVAGAANPLTFNYSNSTAITAYAKPTGAVVVGRNFFNPALVDRIQAGGGEVYQYVDVIDGWFTTYTATGDQAALYGGARTNPAYLWKPSRSNWPNTYLTDMRPGSPWILHAVEHIRKWFPTTHARGIFLDVVGERLWSGAWTAMSASERTAWTAGNRDFVRRLRAALGPRVILVANNSWPGGNPDLNGVTVEHHAYSSVSFWSKQLGRSDWFKPVRNMVIANSSSEAWRWATVPGVTHVSAQSSYGNPVAPLLPFSALPGVSGGGSTEIPPPDLEPPPTPPASGDAVLAGNLLDNPSFEAGTTGWSSWRGTLSAVSSASAPDGTRIAQATFGGTGTSFTIGDFPGGATIPAAGARYTARAYVRAGVGGSVGKPATLYLRERTAGGTTVQEVRGTTRSLTTGFGTVTGSITARTTGNRIDVFVVHDQAVSGNVLQADAISMARQG